MSIVIEDTIQHKLEVEKQRKKKEKEYWSERKIIQMHLSFFSAFSGSVAIMFAIHYLIWTRGLLNNCKLTSGWWPQFLEIERDEVYALNEFIHLVSANKNDQDTLIVLFTPGQGGSYFQVELILGIKSYKYIEIP